MKFEIIRASNWQEKPHEGAVRETFPNVDVRSVDSPYKIWGSKDEVERNWFNEGRNHRVENGKIKRDLPDEECWVIEFRTLEEFVSFKEDVGDVLMTGCSSIFGLKLLTIKDA